MTFSLDKHRLPLFHTDDQRLEPLGVWIIADISIYKQVCLDALAMIADVSAGRPPFEPWSSDKFDVAFSESGITIQNLWIPDQHGEYTLAETRDTVENYWRFLVAVPDNPNLIREYRPDLPEWQADLLMWEESWKRPHPYRGVFF
ncbi:hypothetical protein [Actinomadura gamaensis]|uniref:Uncharacterized protein n=1 Tax=Actinomadura gamaensis TaxID=1763541 RepID=A0ABV9UAC5_9ACTN